MKYAFITDTHLGARNSSNIFRQYFREWYRDVFFPYLAANNIKTVFHGGDFFDPRSSISVADICYVMNEFIPLIEQYGITLYIISGNHDVMFRNSNETNSLSLFSHCKNVKVISDEILTVPVGNKNVVLCPWLNSENEEEFISEIKSKANSDNILLGHFEIEGALMYKNSPPCEHGTARSIFNGYHKVLSGHFHHPSDDGLIRYIGAAFHYNWQDYGDWRGFIVYESDTDKFEEIENDSCLFTRLEYDYSLINNPALELFVKDQFVELVINAEYSRSKLEEVVATIENFKPIKLDVIDNTIFSAEVTVTENDTVDVKSVKNKDVSDYFIDYVNASDIECKSNVIGKFNEISEEAKAMRVEL